jgi:glycosyltransferase involved in cell wall biosynthesis
LLLEWGFKALIVKILLSLPRPLFPADTGGKIRTLNIFSRLAKRMEIHAISLADRRRDAQAVEEMRQLFPRYTPVFWDETLTFSPRFFVQFALSRFSRYPYFLRKYRVPAFATAIREATAREQYDLVLSDFLQSAVAAMEMSGTRRVIFEHNVEYVIRRRHWERETRPVHKWLLEAEWRKARDIEAEICRIFDHVITVSEEDSRTIEREFGVRHVSHLPTGVDLEYFRLQACVQRPGNVVFVGSMDWHPNEDGIFWFVKEVFPILRTLAPEANVTVVGRNPSPRLQALAGECAGIEITGTVDDVRPYLARAQVVIVPLRIGGGTRIKIFEAMSMSRPVVSTTLGAEGLPVEDGRDILLRDAPQEFAEAVAELLHEPSRREAIGRAARLRVERDHSWEHVADIMAGILARVAGVRTPAAQGSMLAEVSVPPVATGRA